MFGAAGGGTIISGALDVGKVVPHLHETRHITGDQHAPSAFTATQLKLPLARCRPSEGPWHWAATCSQPDQNLDRVDVRSWSARVDARDLEAVADRLPQTVS